MNSLIQKQINYLRMHTFKKHSRGNYGMYGLNFLGSDVIIKMNGDLWQFLWWQPGTENAPFVNANSKQYTFNPRTIYYSDDKNTIMRMEEYNE
jgi:hypothetical protein